jgi:MFS family permease
MQKSGVRARISDPDIWRIYATILALGIAYGVALSLIALFLDERGFGKEAIGSLAAWFALGIVLMSLPAGMLIRRLSAKTTLVLALLGYAGAVAIFPFTSSYLGAGVVRFFDGAFSVAVWVSSETILLTRAPRENKAFVTSLYAISLAVGYVLGPLVARGFVAVAPLRLAFVLAGAIALGAAIFAAARLSRDLPRAPEGEKEPPQTGTRAMLVLLRIKTSCFATFAYGYFQASVVLFLPLYLMQEKGIPKESTILIPAFFAAGMLLFSNVAGRLGDMLGHLAVIRGLAVIGLSMILGFVFLDSYAAMCVAVFVAGASLASISPVSLALQGLCSARQDLCRATALYNAFYAAGMLLGPPISSVLFARSGGAAMLYHLAGLWVAFAAFTWFFRADDPSVTARVEPVGA